MSKYQWAKMPVSWQRDPDTLNDFRSISTGVAIAALKIYVALCLKAKFGPPTDPEAGCAKKSLSELQELTGISRPMIIDGIKILRDFKIVKKKREFINLYRIRDYHSAPSWVKLPTAYLFKGGRTKRIQMIASLPSRGAVVRDALLLYLYLASIIDKNTKKARVSYERIGEVIGLDRSETSSAISFLSGALLINMRPPGDLYDDIFNLTKSNTYWLLGSMPKEPSAN